MVGPAPVPRRERSAGPRFELSDPAVAAPPPAVPRDVAGTAPPRVWQGVVLFLAVAGLLYLVVGLVVPHLPEAAGPRLTPPFTGHRWLEGWAQWDSGWYHEIASHGYSWNRGQQSSIAFFPAYPLVVRAATAVAGGPYVDGILVTLVSGAAVAALLLTWLRDRLSPAAAWTAFGAFLLFPYAFYLYGVVYADTLFIVAVLGAFLLLDADHPVLAGLAGAVATAARPIGVVVVVALVVRALERRGFLRRAEGGTLGGRRARPADAGILLSLVGLGAWCAYLWWRFGDPLAFVTAQADWHQGAGPGTWLKLEFFREAAHPPSPGAWLALMAHPALTVAAACLIPRVFRRFGVGYGIYVTLLICVSALSTKDFFGMARYLLPAFPCFAVVGELLVGRARLRTVVLAVSGLGLVGLTAVFGTGFYLS